MLLKKSTLMISASGVNSHAQENANLNAKLSWLRWKVHYIIIVSTIYLTERSTLKVYSYSMWFIFNVALWKLPHHYYPACKFSILSIFKSYALERCQLMSAKYSLLLKFTSRIKSAKQNHFKGQRYWYLNYVKCIQSSD